MSSYRPRRTRIYGANYDIGESYYKKDLENLDNKARGSRFSNLHTDSAPREDRATPKVSFLHDADDDEIFKYKPMKPMKTNAYINDDSDGEGASSTFKRYTSKLDTSDDFNYGDSVKKDIFKKANDLIGKERTPFLNDTENQVSNGFTSRFLKVKSERVVESSGTSSSALASSSSASVQATSRAKATKARLADLDAEMLSITEKQNEREKRNHSLRKLLSEADSDATTSMKKITF